MVEAEITDSSTAARWSYPHGFGLVHLEKVYGVNVNRLARQNIETVWRQPLCTGISPAG